jgi:hypothetical protein
VAVGCQFLDLLLKLFDFRVGGFRVTVMGAARVDADSVDRPIHTDALSEATDGFHRIFALEVDDLGALIGGHSEAIGHGVHGQHPARAHQARARDAKLSHRPATESTLKRSLRA